MSSVFPRLVEDDVYLCGFTSPKSYGSMSYFIKHPQGHWLIDSPRLEPHLVDEFRKMGGLSYIFLTHRDDVADAALYAKEFGAKRIIHEDDQVAQKDAEILVKGQAPFTPVPGFTIIPVPGHTKGHCVLLYNNKFLFTGDHMEFDPDDGEQWKNKAAGHLNAYKDFCWYSWEEQIKSMKKLLDYQFEWVMPGHGGRIKLPPDKMKEELKNLIERM